MGRSARPKRVKVQRKRAVSSTAGKPTQAKVQAKRLAAKKTPKREGSEVRELEKRLAEALEQRAEALKQQAATSEILRVISASPTDVRPVLDAVAERAALLCKAPFARVLLTYGDRLRVAAEHSVDGTVQARTTGAPLRRTSITGRAILDRAIMHHADILPLLDTEFPDARENARRLGFRAVLAVPLMHEGGALGAIFLWRREPGLFASQHVALVETFARQAAIAIDHARLFNETKEALEQQTATSEILRVISRSPMSVQPVFDTIVSATLRLCSARSANLFTFDGQLLHLAAHARPTGERDDAVAVDSLAMQRNFPRPPGRDLAAPRAVLTCSVVSIPDVLADAEYTFKEAALAGGFRSVLAVPLLREGSPIGAIVVGRPEPGSFPETHIALLKTFADQAVIAIGNVRLFDEVQARTHELSESLHQQTATADVLKVISRSAFDLQTVLDTLTESACTLCEAETANIWRPDGDGYKVAAMFGHTPEHAEALKRYVNKPGRDTCVGRTLLEGRTVHIHDAKADPEYNAPDIIAVRGNRAMVGVPLLREGAPIGVLVLTRTIARPFTEQQIALATSFADQAVIAIENVRLFNETKEALERQTATSEILRVISQSPRDVQPVFDTIVKSAVRLCEARFGAVFRLDGGLVHLAAHHNLSETLLAQWFHTGRVSYPMPPNRGHVSGRTILAGAAVQVPDILADEEYLGAGMKTVGFRSLLGVPLLRDGRAIGAIVIYRTEAGHFADKHIELLNTFADQAVIAVENVRLFTELEARTAQLTRSVGELKALGEVGQAVSSTLDLETVLSTIVSRAVQLAGMAGGSIWEYDEAREQFYVRATDRLPDELVEAQRTTSIRKGEGAMGRLAITSDPVEIRDIADESSYQSRFREILIRCGYRSVLAVPLLRQDHLLGALAVNRTTPGEFAPEVIALLKTFATQSALAIQNARLYREIEVKSKELEAASRHKSEFLANMSHELRTPLNAIIGFSEVLSERMFGEINEKQAEYVSDILQSGQHLLSLINDILDLSKIEAGRMELEPSDFDLVSTIENTLILVRERAQRRGITLGSTVDERLRTIRADERKVKQVLLNLLSNALKFTPEGGKIDVRAAVNDGVAEISVTDTGIGISPEDQEAVFEEFRQVGTASKKVEGTGLGLAISKKFIELHGGKIWVTSQVGTGSTFAFTLPL